MGYRTLALPQHITVNRSELRQKQRATLKKAKGRTVVVVSGSDPEEERLIVDREYFEDLVRKLRSALETLSITMDERLFPQILAASKTLDSDVRAGKLRRFEEVFGGE